MQKRVIVFGAALSALLAVPAFGDNLPVFDQKGQPQTIDTTTLTGCQVIFDKAGTPFELCRMQRVELRPPQSTRARPGHGAPAGDVSVIYTKKISQ